MYDFRQKLSHLGQPAYPQMDMRLLTPAHASDTSRQALTRSYVHRQRLGQTVRDTDSKKKFVLLAEDDTALRDVVAEVLEAEGFIVERVSDGLAGILQAYEHPPALIVVDLHLPVIEGSALVEALRENGDVPVLAISGHADGEAVAAKMRADKYLAKPFTVQELQQAVRDLTGEIPTWVDVAFT